MADGIGGAIANLMMGNPAAQLNQALAGPQPNPVSASGGQQGAMSPQQGPAMAQPQATQPPPDLARLYLQLEQSRQMGEGFNRGLGMFLGGFKGPPGGAQQIMQGMTGGGSQDPGALLQNLLQMRQQQALQAGLPAMLQKAGLDPSYAPLAMADPTFLPKVIESQMGLTGDPVQRELAQARAEEKRKHPDWTEEQIIANKPELESPLTYQGAKTEQGKTISITSTQKADAISTFPGLDKPYQDAEDNIQWLYDHPQATAAAVHWGAQASGRTGQGLKALGTIDSDTIDARARLDRLNDQQFRAGLTDVKNVRSQSEANKIGSSMSALDKPGNSDDLIQSELSRLRSTAMTARANLIAAAGKQVPYKYKGMADPIYLDSKSGLYNGATEEAPPKEEVAPSQSQSGKELSSEEMTQAKSLIAQHGREWVIKYLQGKGYKTDGL